MEKHLHAVQFGGMTFGMPLETNTEAYKKFKKAIKRERAIGRYDNEIYILTVPYLSLAAIMREAHWLVSERKLFNKISVDGFIDEDIYVKYSDDKIDLRNR